MRGGRGSTRTHRVQALIVTVLLMLGLTTISATVGPAPDAAAATVAIGTIQAQMTDHLGVNNGTSRQLHQVCTDRHIELVGAGEQPQRGADGARPATVCQQ